MKNIIRFIWILVFAAAGWFAWGKYDAMVKAEQAADAAGKAARQVVPVRARTMDAGVTFFTCDARSCGQMTSCEEARYFMKSCGMNPGASGEGAPSCEKQWCKK